MRNSDNYVCIDLFAGAGGLSDGFQKCSFRIVSAIDSDDVSAETYRRTHPETNFLECPIEGLSAKELMRGSSLRRGDLDCLVGGPPCQAFSVYNHQRGMHDERSGLFREYLRLVKEIFPKTLVMENVTGITSVGRGTAVREICENLGKIGYRVSYQILKAEEFGVPQERRRIFFIATRLDDVPILFPHPTHGPPDLFGMNRHRFVTVGDAISDLPRLSLSEGDEIQDYPGRAESAYQRTLRGRSRKIHNHVAPRLSEINVERMKHIPPGGSWRDIPFSLLPAGMKRAKRSDHTKRYGRLESDGLASTILTKCDIHWGAYVHPDQDRTLTVREAARLQSFPDTTRFSGSRSNQYRQVGNAVPPLLAKAVASSIHEMLSLGSDRRCRNRKVSYAASTG